MTSQSLYSSLNLGRKVLLQAFFFNSPPSPDLERRKLPRFKKPVKRHAVDAQVVRGFRKGEEGGVNHRLVLIDHYNDLEK